MSGKKPSRRPLAPAPPHGVREETAQPRRNSRRPPGAGQPQQAQPAQRHNRTMEFAPQRPAGVAPVVPTREEIPTIPPRRPSRAKSAENIETLTFVSVPPEASDAGDLPPIEWNLSERPAEPEAPARLPAVQAGAQRFTPLQTPQSASGFAPAPSPAAPQRAPAPQAPQAPSTQLYAQPAPHPQSAPHPQPAPHAQPAPSPAQPRAPTPAPGRRRAPTPVAAAVDEGPPLPRDPAGVPGLNRVDRLLVAMCSLGASDLHLSSGRPPGLRLGGGIEPLRWGPVDDREMVSLLKPITPPHLWEQYVDEGDVDFAYEVPGLSRFRVNLFRQERGMGAVFRVIPTKIKTAKELGLPESVRRVAGLRSGLVLVTGPTGSGKSTTLAAIINEMNEARRMHFVTIEDPIEFVHPNKMSLMSQREIGPHSRSFSSALRAAVREDPDAILVGEMRDLETISMALAAAETGVLVFGTLHTNSAAKTLDRIINVFPADKQPGVRGTLASVTRCVVAQQLLRRKGGGRVAAVEVMFGSPALASMIREGKTHQISGLIKLGRKEGMIAMDDALRRLVEEGVIDPAAGLEKSIDKDEFRRWLKENGAKVPDDAP